MVACVTTAVRLLSETARDCRPAGFLRVGEERWSGVGGEQNYQALMPGAMLTSLPAKAPIVHLSIMQLVADTNVFLAVALDEPERGHILELTRDTDLIAPEVLPYEIGNALSAMCRRGQLSRREAKRVYTVTQQVPVRLLSVDIAKALDLAMQAGIYAYDGCFLRCARAQGCPLMTLDRRMRRVATDFGIEILE